LTPAKGAFYVANRRDLVCFCLNESLGNFIAKVWGAWKAWDYRRWAEEG
jgi:hypothetical protein